MGKGEIFTNHKKSINAVQLMHLAARFIRTKELNWMEKTEATGLAKVQFLLKFSLLLSMKTILVSLHPIEQYIFQNFLTYQASLIYKKRQFYGHGDGREGIPSPYYI